MTTAARCAATAQSSCCEFAELNRPGSNNPTVTVKTLTRGFSLSLLVADVLDLVVCVTVDATVAHQQR